MNRNGLSLCLLWACAIGFTAEAWLGFVGLGHTVLPVAVQGSGSALILLVYLVWAPIKRLGFSPTP